MKPDLILHIGQSKTGTSSIQRVLGARRPELLAEGVLYPRSPGAANHALLPASLVPLRALAGFHPGLWEGLGPQGRLDRFRQEFAEEMGTLGPGVLKVVISAEQCAGLLGDVDRIAALRELLDAYVDRTTVVIYLRRQDQHWASSYTQALRVAAIRPAELPQEGPDRLSSYDYAALLDRWAAVYGDAQVRPLIFEPAALEGGDVVDDFFAVCGLRFRAPKDDPNRQSNLAITPEGLALVRAMGAHMAAADPDGFGPDSLVWRRFVQRVSEAMPGRGWRPSAAESAAFMSRFETVNETVRRRWFPERARLFSDADLRAAAHAPIASDPAGDDAAEALSAALAMLLQQIADGSRREAEHALKLGRLQEKLGDQTAARSSYMAAVRADPGLTQAHFHIAQIDLGRGDVAAAQLRLESLRRLHPDDEFTARLARRLKGGAPSA